MIKQVRGEEEVYFYFNVSVWKGFTSGGVGSRTGLGLLRALWHYLVPVLRSRGVYSSVSRGFGAEGTNSSFSGGASWGSAAPKSPSQE